MNEDTLIEEMLMLLRLNYLKNRAEGLSPTVARQGAIERLNQLASNCAFVAFDHCYNLPDLRPEESA
jgi:hypothetical protein